MQPGILQFHFLVSPCSTSPWPSTYRMWTRREDSKQLPKRGSYLPKWIINIIGNGNLLNPFSNHTVIARCFTAWESPEKSRQDIHVKAQGKWRRDGRAPQCFWTKSIMFDVISVPDAGITFEHSSLIHNIFLKFRIRLNFKNQRRHFNHIHFIIKWMSCFGCKRWTVNKDEKPGLWNQTAWVQIPAVI